MLRVRTAFTGPPGSPYLNTMYFSGSTNLEANDAVAAVGAYWGAVDAIMDTDVTWTTEPDVAVIDFLTGELTSIFGTTPVVGQGGTAGDQLPLATQALCRWFTGGFVAGRRVRGRTFIPALTEAHSTSGRPIAAVATAVNAAAAALVADTASEFVIWARPTVAPAPVRAGSTHAVTSGSSWSEFAVLRSRRD